MDGGELTLQIDRLAARGDGVARAPDGRVVFGGCDAVLHVVSTETGERVMKKFVIIR